LFTVFKFLSESGFVLLDKAFYFLVFRLDCLLYAFLIQFLMQKAGVIQHFEVFVFVAVEHSIEIRRVHLIHFILNQLFGSAFILLVFFLAFFDVALIKLLLDWEWNSQNSKSGAKEQQNNHN